MLTQLLSILFQYFSIRRLAFSSIWDSKKCCHSKIRVIIFQFFIQFLKVQKQKWAGLPSNPLLSATYFVRSSSRTFMITIISHQIGSNKFGIFINRRSIVFLQTLFAKHVLKIYLSFCYSSFELIIYPLFVSNTYLFFKISLSVVIH